MKLTIETDEQVTLPQISILPKPKAQPAYKDPFRIVAFTNRAGSQSWRVAGFKRDRTRVRENFAEQIRAEARKLELTTEWLTGERQTEMQATKLTPEQCRIAEAAFMRLPNAVDMLPAVEHWLKTGKQHEVKEQVRIDDAFEQFKAWLDTHSDAAHFARDYKNTLRNRVSIFVNSIGNMLLPTITPETIKDFLEKRDVARQTKTNDRINLSRFFVWCKSKKWVVTNPAQKEGKSPRPTRPEPVVVSVADAQRLLQSAEKFKRGRLAPYVAVCLFGGLRPSEAKRLDWTRVNLDDGEISVSNKNKTHRTRTLKIGTTLAAWLQKYEGKPFHPANWRNDFDAVRVAAGFGNPENDKKLKPWVEDIMRHTAISHYFRKCGSYGLTAEWAGNSEDIIKEHYQGKVSTADTKKFYALRPAKKGGRK